MTRLSVGAIAFVVGLCSHAYVYGQTQNPSKKPFAGDWRVGAGPAGAYTWIIVIEQTGTELRGSWKESYRERSVTCSGIWFEGKLQGGKVSGTRYSCDGRAQPLSILVVDEDTLDVNILSGGTGSATRLQRIKAMRE